ncbi:hypothetical protein M752DRAFT_274820 [Aspergillus phoenicis ATCC 13157]|uniref:Uncharacterized protein n=1 Tax=Aspergillus phoenicis ATCC 13157 TaxID=1353007 RepID=A0A370PQR2_ASPPH|nr:hypothetical protein M752DRAFT_274820 [Aspergillus phoenicis ATCC 13157]
MPFFKKNPVPPQPMDGNWGTCDKKINAHKSQAYCCDASQSQAYCCDASPSSQAYCCDASPSQAQCNEK